MILLPEFIFIVSEQLETHIIKFHFYLAIEQRGKVERLILQHFHLALMSYWESLELTIDNVPKHLAVVYTEFYVYGQLCEASN